MSGILFFLWSHPLTFISAGVILVCIIFALRLLVGIGKEFESERWSGQ